jgi:small-conductance mechanosensitive channel
MSYTQETPPAADPKDSTEVIRPQAIPLVDINLRMEETRQFLADISDELEYTPVLEEIDSMIIVREDFLNEEAESFRDYNPYNLSKFFLENTYRAWEGYYTQLDRWKKTVNQALSSSKDNKADLEFYLKEWQLTLESTEGASESQEIRQRIRELIDGLNETISGFNSKVTELIELEAIITDAMTFSDGIMEDVGQLQQNLRDSLLIAREKPLWDISLQLKNIDYFKGRIHKLSQENKKVINNYLESLNLTFYFITILVITLLLIQLRRRYFRLRDLHQLRGYMDARRILKENFLPTLFALYVFSFILIVPYNPLAFSAFLTLLLLICIRYALGGYTGPTGKRIIWILAALMFLNQFEIVMWYFADWARLYIFFEASAVVLAAFYVIHPSRRRKILSEPPYLRVATKIAYIVLFLGAAAFLSNLLGYLDLAVLLLKVSIESSIAILVVASLAKIIRVILISFNNILLSLKDNTLEKYLGKIESGTVHIINILAVIYLFFSLLSILEIRRPVQDYLVRNIEYKWVVGTMTISVGGVLLLALILFVTYLISGLVKILIEEEIASRVKLPKGIPFAISVTIRYFIIILGFVMALSAAGIDLSEFGLIAGALGIGIGFGLQNIVGNFISGLILIYERPIQSGDTVEVGNLMGQVKRIGIRSSNVKTYDGAEVVVPNSNLVSNDLINWTLSDSRRRIEIKVGVAYGSDPNKVLELLKKVARDHEHVLEDPEPIALFEEFGDSSLNFRLLFWVYFEDGFITKSDVAIGIYNIFNENNISIPFPQIDLHVKDKGESNEK